MKTSSVKPSAVKATEVVRSGETAEIGRMSPLMVFPGMMDHEGVSAIPTYMIPTNTPVWPIRVAKALAIGRAASAAHNTK
jgi:hypothetical protein